MGENDRLVSIRVRPRAARPGVRTAADGALVVHVHAAAAEGAANRECVAVLAKALGVAKSRVQIVRGEKSRSKQIAVQGLKEAEVQTRLRSSAEGDGRA